MQVLYWPVLGLIQFCSFDRRCKTCLDTKLVLIPLQNWLCASSKTSFMPSLYLLHQNRLCAYAKPTAPKPALCLLQNRLCAYAKPTAPKPALCCVRLQNLPWYKTCLVSRQVLHLLSKLQNWICSKTGQYKTCLVSNTKDWLCVYKYIYIYILDICLFFIYIRLYIYVYILNIYIWNIHKENICKNWLCACSKTSFVPSLNLLHQNRLCACS